MAGLVVVSVLVGSPSAAAQEVANGGSTWVGPWHAAMGLAVRLSSDSAAMADILAGAESALALGRPVQALELLSRHLLPDSMAEGAPLAVHAASQYALGAVRRSGKDVRQSRQPRHRTEARNPACAGCRVVRARRPPGASFVTVPTGGYRLPRCERVSTPVEKVTNVAGENVTPGGGDEPLVRRLLLCSCSLFLGG